MTRENAPLPRLSSRCDTNLRPFGAPPSMGRRENAASQTPHKEGLQHENAASPHMTFIPLREPTSAPSDRLLPKEGGGIPLPRIHHFERKREIFFVRGKAKDVRGTASEKHPAPCAPEERYFMQTTPHRKRNTANEKDPSAALGMTIREYRLSAQLSVLCESQPPPLWGTSFHRKEGECRFARIRHFERKREIFFVRGKTKAVRGTASGKHPAPCAPKKRCFMQAVSCRKMKEKSISNRR